MIITGNFYEVSHLEAFVLNTANPVQESYSPASNVRVFLSFIPNNTIPLNFFPTFSVSDDTDSSGKFEININDNVIQSMSNLGDFYILAHKKVGDMTMPYGVTIPIFNPVYRSEKFKITQSVQNLRCYFAKRTLNPENFILQSHINSQISSVREGFNQLERLSGTIQQREINVSGKHESGVTIKFDIKLLPFTGSDLNRTIKQEVENFDIDMPGPDFIAEFLCIDFDEIEKIVRRKISAIANTAGTQIKERINDAIVEAIPNEAVQERVLKIFKDNFVITFGEVKFPVVDNRTINVGGVNINIPVRAVEPVPYFGFPRRLI